jgi:hypothetical protein
MKTTLALIALAICCLSQEALAGGPVEDINKLLNQPDGGTLKLTWTNCGSGASATITDLSPTTLQLGTTTSIGGTGKLTKDVTGGTWTMSMTGVGGVNLIKGCSGDASTPKTCKIGLGPISIGSGKFGGVPMPVKAGPSVKLPNLVAITLPSGIPGFATKTTTTLNVKASDGSLVFCAQIKSAPADDADRVAVTPVEDEWTRTDVVPGSANPPHLSSCTGSGTLPGNGPFCYHASIGMLGVKETLDFKVVRTGGEFAVANGEAQITTEKGTMDLVGSGVSPFKCSGVGITKNGQSVSPDMSALQKCLPRGVSIKSVEYCSDTNEVQVTISDSNIPVVGKSITKKAQIVKCQLDFRAR